MGGFAETPNISAICTVGRNPRRGCLSPKLSPSLSRIVSLLDRVDHAAAEAGDAPAHDDVEPAAPRVLKHAIKRRPARLGSALALVDAAVVDLPAASGDVAHHLGELVLGVLLVGADAEVQGGVGRWRGRARQVSAGDREGKVILRPKSAPAIVRAIAQKSFGARFVRALCDQARFHRGLGEPPEPIVTGNPKADDLVVEPHDMETYDALFDRQRKTADQPDDHESH